MDSSFKARKGGAFKLNLSPKAYFDGNPYKSDRRKYFVQNYFVTSRKRKIIAFRCKLLAWSPSSSPINFKGDGKGHCFIP